MTGILLGLIPALFVLGGCTEYDSGSGSADCTIVVRLSEGTYYQDGWTDSPSEVIGQAELSSCSDTGKDAIGPYFSDDPAIIDAYSVVGKDQDRVIAVPTGDGGSYRLMRIGPSLD